MKAIKRITLAQMPFDVWDPFFNTFRRPTGDEVTLEDGTITLEFEGEEYEDAKDCVYEVEEEEEEE